MKNLRRFGVSIEKDLLGRFDRFVRKAGYAGRSEAFRDLIRARLVDEEIRDDDAHVFGVLSLVYDHHHRLLNEKLTSIQHDHHQNIISNTHVHIDHENCLEVILLKGATREVKQIGSEISSMKGVAHARLTFTTVQDGKKGRQHSHHHD